MEESRREGQNVQTMKLQDLMKETKYLITSFCFLTCVFITVVMVIYNLIVRSLLQPILDKQVIPAAVSISHSSISVFRDKCGRSINHISIPPFCFCNGGSVVVYHKCHRGHVKRSPHSFHLNFPLTFPAIVEYGFQFVILSNNKLFLVKIYMKSCF